MRHRKVKGLAQDSYGEMDYTLQDNLKKRKEKKKKGILRGPLFILFKN